MSERGKGMGLQDSWGWLRFAAGLPTRPVPVPAAGGSGLVASGRLIMMGLSVANTATAAGAVQVHDGVDATGQLVYDAHIAASADLNPAFPAGGVLLEIGCYLEVSTAVLAGAIWLVPLWHYQDTPPGE